MYLKIALKVTHPFRKRQFRQIPISASAVVTSSEKSSIRPITNRKLGTCAFHRAIDELCALKEKGQEAYLYSAFYILCTSQSAQAWITQFYLQIHPACLSFVCVHQMAPPLTEVRDI